MTPPVICSCGHVFPAGETGYAGPGLMVKHWQASHQLKISAVALAPPERMAEQRAALIALLLPHAQVEYIPPDRWAERQTNHQADAFRDAMRRVRFRTSNLWGD